MISPLRRPTTQKSRLKYFRGPDRSKVLWFTYTEAPRVTVHTSQSKKGPTTRVLSHGGTETLQKFPTVFSEG